MLILWDCHDDANQPWIVNIDGTVTGTGDTCLDVTSGATTPGAPSSCGLRWKRPSPGSASHRCCAGASEPGVPPTPLRCARYQVSALLGIT